MSARNKRKRRKPRNPRQPAAPAQYALGDKVRVKYGVVDPEYPDIPLGGWSGTVAETDEGRRQRVYLVVWDRFTQENRHPVFAVRCERDGMNEKSYWLEEDDLEPDENGPVALEEPTALVTRPLRTTEPHDRVRAIFGLTSDDPLPEGNEANSRKYHAFLAERMSFPFQAVYWQECQTLAMHQRRVTVLGLVDLDCYDPQDRGLLCSVEYEESDSSPVLVERVRCDTGLSGLISYLLGLKPVREKTDDRWIPLADLELRTKGPNRTLVADYCHWLVGD